jgi:ABC-type lipoprotein export system ATPase subunit
VRRGERDRNVGDLAKASGMNEPAIALREVFCVHRTREGDVAALQGLDLTLGAGERLCVLGPSGAGKTTLLRVIAGLQTPSVGRVHVLGVDVGRLRPRERARLRHQSMGFLEQRAEATLAPELRVLDAVGLPLALRGATRRERRVRAEGLLDAAGLGDRMRALPGELSGGERQRAALCAALAHRPALLLADEPTAELDDRSAAAVVGLIDALAAIERTTVVMVTHDMAVAERAPRVVRIRDGRVVEAGNAGRAGLVVGRGGWIRLPEEILRETGIGGLAEATAVPGGLLLSGASGGVRPDEAAGASPTGQARGLVTPGPPPASVTPALPGATVTPVALELRSVSRHRGRGRGHRAVLRSLTARVAPGALTVVTGPSGSGKTTLLELLAGLAAPDAGEVLLDGRSLGDAGPEGRARIRRERIGYLPQEPSPIAFLSAAENVTLALRLRGRAEAAAGAAARAALGDVGLPPAVHAQRVQRLSAGEAQRVALARALACADGLLIVDEPTSRLDESGAAAVAQLLTCAAADGHTVVCATHDQEIVRRAQHVLELGRSRDTVPAPRPDAATV